MIDNINLIKPLLKFSNKWDFYMLYVLKRKKDQPEGEKDNHQSVRTIKTYTIESLEYLDKRYDEIKMLCEVFKARAYIHVQKQNYKDVSYEMSIRLAEKIRDGQYNQKNLFDSIVGELKVYEKRWVVDIDTQNRREIVRIKRTINDLRPVGEKVEAIIPTKSGVHLITKKFDSNEFEQHYPNVDVQKKNPTLLYYPDSLSL